MDRFAQIEELRREIKVLAHEGDSPSEASAQYAPSKKIAATATREP